MPQHLVIGALVNVDVELPVREVVGEQVTGVHGQRRLADAVQRLVDVLWTEDPPATATKQVQNCVSSLRGRLAEVGPSTIIVTDGPGYRIMVGDDQVDALRFRSGIHRATELAVEGRVADAVAASRAALALWRGPALDGIGAPTLMHRATHLDEQRLLAIEQCIDWQFALG